MMGSGGAASTNGVGGPTSTVASSGVGDEGSPCEHAEAVERRRKTTARRTLA
jgi:hypothetical protein